MLALQRRFACLEQVSDQCSCGAAAFEIAWHSLHSEFALGDCRGYKLWSLEGWPISTSN